MSAAPSSDTWFERNAVVLARALPSAMFKSIERVENEMAAVVDQVSRVVEPRAFAHAAAVRCSGPIPHPSGGWDVGFGDAGCVTAVGVVPAQLDVVEEQAGDELEVVRGRLVDAEQAGDSG